MAQLTYTTAITQIRAWIQDADTTAQALTDAQIGALINNWYLWMYPQGEPKLIYDNATTMGITVANGIGTTSPTTYARIVEVYASNTSPDNPIRTVTIPELIQSRDTGVADRPYECAMFRLATGAWQLWFNSAGLASQKISCLAEYEPAELSGTNPILLRPHETRLVAALASLDAAMMIGRPPSVTDWLNKMVDRYMPLINQENAKTIKPRGVPGRA